MLLLENCFLIIQLIESLFHYLQCDMRGTVAAHEQQRLRVFLWISRPGESIKSSRFTSHVHRPIHSIPLA